MQRDGRRRGGRLGDGGQQRQVRVHAGAVAGDDDSVLGEVDGQRLIEGDRRAVGPRPAVRASGREVGRVRIRLGHKGFTQRDVELDRPGVGGAGTGGGRQHPAGSRAPLGVERIEAVRDVFGQAQADGGADLGAEVAELLHGLVGAGAEKFVGPVGAEHDERNAGVVGLDDRRAEVGHRGAGGHRDGNRASAAGGQSDCQVAGGALVDADVQAQRPGPVGVGQGERQRGVAAARAQHDVTHAAADEFVHNDPRLGRRRIHHEHRLPHHQMRVPAKKSSIAALTCSGRSRNPRWPALAICT